MHPMCLRLLDMNVNNVTHWPLQDNWSVMDNNVTEWSMDNNMTDWRLDYGVGNMTSEVFRDKARYKHFRGIAYGYILPIILAFGILGNALNIAVFGQKRLWIQQDAMEKSAMIGLLSLAVADLLFCFTGFPSAFIEVRYYIGQNDYSFSTLAALYYTTYRSCFLNVFVYMSTWFIITLSVERYFAVVHPFQAKNFISVNKTILVKLIVIIISIIINIPDFLRYTIEKINCGETGQCNGCYVVHPNPAFLGSTLVTAFNLLWHITGTLFPLLVLTFCNIRLVVEIYRSVKHSQRHHRQQQDARAITVILILIISMFLVLVCPSMLLTFLTEHVIDRGSVQHFQIALVVTNLSQALNFAINFLLYCAFSPKFRRGLLHCAQPASPAQSNDVVTGLI